MGEEKKCSRCGETKPATAGFFYRDRGRLTPACRICKRADVEAYRTKYPERHKASQHAWRVKNVDYIRVKNKAYWAADPDLHKARCAAWQAKNLARHRENARTYFAKNREAVRASRISRRPQIRLTDAARRERNRDAIRAYKRAAYAADANATAKRRAFREQHLESERARCRLYQKRRYALDAKYALRARFSRAVRHSLTSGGKKGRSWESLVGYTLDDLRQHLERQFRPGMTWQNMGRGGWHIDHILPLSGFAFASADDSEFRAAWALPNLRPLWERENISKGARRTLLL